MTYTVSDLTLSRSNTGDGGWSLHLKDEFYPLLTGKSEWIEETQEQYGHWSGPTEDDYEEALRVANRDELPNCVWRGAETPFAENH